MWSCLNAVTLVTILPGIEQLLPNLQLYTLRQQTDEKLRERNRKLIRQHFEFGLLYM